jgi:subtilisin family serine protease
MRSRLAILMAIGAVSAVPAWAQLGLPPLGGTVRDVVGTVDRTLDPLTQTASHVVSRAAQLAQQRAERLSTLVRRNRESIEFDDAGEPARKGELLLLEPGEADLAAARQAGFGLIERDRLDELGISVARLSVPVGMRLARAEAALRKALPQATIAADNLHFPSGDKRTATAGSTLSGAPAIETQIGLIDGGPGPSLHVGALRGFAAGAPRPSDHGSATASLLQLAGARRIAVADVYGADPAGGNALAISQAVNWLLGQRARVISIGLVGPNNALLGRAIAAARRRGVIFVAAVGNDGPAAPPAYPASYPGVIAVTGVDGRNRALIEAGRALHLDYAAPGADMVAANAAGRWVRVRGTSYAAPLAAARAAAAVGRGANVKAALDREAVDLGRKGPDTTYGRGLLCGACRRSR